MVLAFRIDVFFCFFYLFSASLFWCFFEGVFSGFFTKMAPKMASKNSIWYSFFGFENRYFPAGLLFGGPLVVLAPFLVRFGSLWAHFMIILLILDNFETFLIHLAAFWHHVCSKIMFFDPLAAAKHHFGTLLVILNKCSIKIEFSVPFSAEDLQNTDGTSDEGAFPLHWYLSHLARSGNLP